ncbi:MAG: aldehyde dehydrogenase family protein, partial [Actinophytocola sp.]|nr:aldehyde dehydrogenase family protein [Actinophytocola sp.]
PVALSPSLVPRSVAPDESRRVCEDGEMLGAAAAIFNNAGQVCTAGSRLFLESPVFDAVVTGVADIARDLRVGHGMDPQSQMGPLISAVHRDRVLDYLDSGVEEGAELLCGGHSFGDGYFVEPTVLVRATRKMRAVREEIFGPVVAAMPFDDVPAAIGAANDIKYGLSGS